jgi:uncharacterized protein DUF4304
MSVDYRRVFADQLKERFAPALRSVGFKGSGTHFRRTNGEIINTIWIQGSRDGTKCAVNLGLHLTFLPMNWKDELPNTAISEIDCEFRDRLSPPGMEDYWWEYGSLLSPPSKHVAHLHSVYFEHGEARFRRFDTVEAVAQMFSPEQLRSGPYMSGFGGITVPRAALAMARIRVWLGQKEFAAEYARVGLEKLGKASGLRLVLEGLANAA